MGFSYIKHKSASIAATGTGNPDWHAPISDGAYSTAGEALANDLSVEQVAFRDICAQQTEPSSE